MESNLSKIKPKLRTQGRITGNFGRSKVRTNGNADLGVTKAENVTITSPDDYIQKMYHVLDVSDDQRLRDFAYAEIKRYLIQTGQWK